MSAVATPLPVKLSAEELAERRYNYASMMGTTLAEGVSPSPEAIAIFQRYASGEIEMDECGRLVRAIDGL